MPGAVVAIDKMPPNFWSTRIIRSTRDGWDIQNLRMVRLAIFHSTLHMAPWVLMATATVSLWGLNPFFRKSAPTLLRIFLFRFR